VPTSAIKLSKNEIIKEYWHRGDLRHKLHAAQKVLQETYTRGKGQLFVANCSRQWGKSFWAVTKAIEAALQQPKTQVRYGAAFQTDLEEFILPAFDKILEDCPVELTPRYNAKTSSWIFPNKSRIKLIGVDKKPNGLRGNTLDLIIGDEVGFWAKLDYIYKSVIVPSTLHRPNCRIILISTPPSTPAHEFVDYVQRAEAEGSYVKLDIHTNPLITPDDILRMEKENGGSDSTTFRREFLCEFVTDGDLAIIPEWKDELIEALEPDEFNQYYDRYIGMDLGVKDLTAMLYGYYDFKRATLVIEDEDEMSGPSMTTEKLVTAIRNKETSLWGDLRKYWAMQEEMSGKKKAIPYRRIADNNWPLLIADLNSIHNMTFIDTSKDNLEAMINEVRLLVASGRIRIHPRCTKLIGCVRYGVWDEKKKAFARSNVYGHFDHLAALIYLVRNLSTNTNPIPADHSFGTHKAFKFHIKDKDISHNARTISKSLGLNRREVSTSPMRHRRKF
jgi:hypothetical protein